jgi:hypothetical protein
MLDHIDQVFLALTLGTRRRRYDGNRVIPALKRQNATLRDGNIKPKHMLERGNESSPTECKEGGMHTECTDQRDVREQQGASSVS